MPAHIAQVIPVVIFVVPDSVLQSEPPLPLGKGLPATPRQIKLAHLHVEKEAPALVHDVKAIIVLGDKAATFLHGVLVPHEAAVREAAIRVFTESDVIEWVCDQAFSIVSTGKAHNPIWREPTAPDNPFYTGPPYDAEYGADTRYRAQSTKTRKEANGQQYKVSIRIGNRLIDPDYVCGSPPPV